jgi:hypothetical protein
MRMLLVSMLGASNKSARASCSSPADGRLVPRAASEPGAPASDAARHIERHPAEA